MTNLQNLPDAIYVWLVPSEEVQDQPGSWRIRKWDTEPFPEANFTLRSGPNYGLKREEGTQLAVKASMVAQWALQGVLVTNPVFKQYCLDTRFAANQWLRGEGLSGTANPLPVPACNATLESNK